MNLKDRNDKQRQTEQKLYQSQIAKLHKDQGTVNKLSSFSFILVSPE